MNQKVVDKAVGVIAIYDGKLIVDAYNDVILFKDSEQASSKGGAPSGSILYRVVKSSIRKEKIGPETIYPDPYAEIPKTKKNYVGPDGGCLACGRAGGESGSPCMQCGGQPTGGDPERLKIAR